MAGLSERYLKAINDNPINNALGDFRTTFKSTYPDVDIHEPLANLESVVTDSGELIGTLLLLPAACALLPESGESSLSGEIALLYASLSSNQMNFKHTFRASFVVPFQQTPWSFNTGSFASDLRRDVGPILKGELGSNLIINYSELFNKFFDVVPQLGEIAAAVFEMRKEAETPFYKEGTGWAGWPEDCKESSVLH